jgi:hypothetical protein
VDRTVCRRALSGEDADPVLAGRPTLQANQGESANQGSGQAKANQLIVFIMLPKSFFYYVRA